MGSKYNLRVRIAEIEVVLGGIDRVVIDMRSNRAAASIHAAHIDFLFRRIREQIEATARFGGGIAGDAAVPVTNVADADICAAALFGCVAGDRAAVELAATGILAVEAAAVNAAARFGGYVVLNLAAVEMELCAGRGVDTAAVVGGPVIRDHAAVDRDRPGSGMDTAAGRGGVAGDRAALHREAGIASRDGHSAAVSGDGVAGQCAAVERGVCICADTDAAAAGIGAAERTRANAIAQIQLRRLAFLACQRDGRLGRIGAGKAVAVQAQIQDVLRRNCQIGRHIAGQIDISNITALFSVFADLNPFLFVCNFALAVPRLPFHVLMGVIERTAADAVVGVGCDGDGNRRRGRCRIVIGFRGISVDFIFAFLRERKVRADLGVSLRSGRLAKHLIICHGRLFLHALHRENRQDLLTNADGILGQLQRHALRRLLSQHGQLQTGAHVVAVHRRRADDGALTGADGFRRQRGCRGKRCVRVVLVIPVIGRGCAAVAVHVGCSSSQSEGVVLVRRQCIAAVPTGDIVSGDRKRRQRRVGHDHVLDAALRRLLRTEPLASRRAAVAELRGTLPVQERTHCATFASVGDAAIAAATALEHQLAGIAAQIADGAVVDNGDNAVFRVLNLDVGGRYVRLDFHCAGLIERDGIRIIRID